jgi:hypothetical protein
MPSKKVSMRASMSNQTSHFGIMGGLSSRKISGISSMNRVTSRLEIPASAKEGYPYMKMHNILSKNPLGSGGVGRMFTVRPRGSGLGGASNLIGNNSNDIEKDVKGVEGVSPWKPSRPLTICLTIDDSIIMSDPGDYSHNIPSSYYLSLLFNKNRDRRKNKNYDKTDGSDCAISLFVTGGFGLKDIFLNSGYMHSIGNEIGNHTVTHGNGMKGGADTMNKYSTDMWKKEFTDMNLMLQTWSGIPEKEIRAFRKPELFKDALSSIPYWQAVIDIANDNPDITYYETSITYNPQQQLDTSMVFIYKPYKITDMSSIPIKLTYFTNTWFNTNLTNLPPNLYIYPMPDLGFISDQDHPNTFGAVQPHDMELPTFKTGGFNAIGMETIINEFINGWTKSDKPTAEPTLFISLHEQNFTKSFVHWINTYVDSGNIKLKTIADAFKEDISLNNSSSFNNSKNYSNFNISQFSTGNWACGASCDVSVSHIPMIGDQTGPYQNSADWACTVPQGLNPQWRPRDTSNNINKCKMVGCSWVSNSQWGPGCVQPDISNITIDLACKTGIITGNIIEISNNCYMTHSINDKIPILDYEDSIDFINTNILKDDTIIYYNPPSDTSAGTFWFGNPLGNTTVPPATSYNLICQNNAYCPTPKLTDTSGCTSHSTTNFCNYDYYSIATAAKASS